MIRKLRPATALLASTALALGAAGCKRGDNPAEPVYAGAPLAGTQGAPLPAAAPGGYLPPAGAAAGSGAAPSAGPSGPTGGAPA